MNHDDSIAVKRQLRGKKRKEIAKRCRIEGAMNVREDLILSVTKNEVIARDLTNVISGDVLRMAVQENKEVERLDKDSYKELDIARDAFLTADVKSKTVKGYIHYLAQYPFTVIFFNEDQLLIYLKELRSNKQLNINFDATGSVVSKMSEKRTFYYTMVINVREFGIFQIADCLTDDNSQASIITFFNTFKKNLQLITTGNIIPFSCTVDFSYATINAVLSCFNEDNLVDYINKLYISCKNKLSVFKVGCRICICSGHMIKNASSNIRYVEPNKKIRKLCLHIFALLQNTSDLEEAKRIYKNSFIIFNSNFHTMEYTKALDYINKKLENVKNKEHDIDLKSMRIIR